MVAIIGFSTFQSIKQCSHWEKVKVKTMSLQNTCDILKLKLRSYRASALMLALALLDRSRNHLSFDANVDIDASYRPQGMVMFSQASVILSTIGLIATRSLLILVTVRLVCILLECFLVFAVIFALVIKVFFPSVNANVDANVSAGALCEYTLTE